ncbi:phosphopantetheine-binding protein [Jannaschia pagri]|uniref:Acyl carrier protein AcpXL n=1 Tax=Jannaschia pagri TaxID=2829797 RepID=A0ABQ4NNN2_9RHOB|nr:MULTISPECIES: acyl carrier protein [unclassified Jannaschia]GIT92169.1 phosphopantetheine-binding protein [Jannaschia sp. AI_61]GIT96004.1 phosphopantetheine-binding protein [Jannaschia sp. AI_62]
MTHDDIRTRVHEIIAEQAMIDPSDITDDASPADLGVDSMGVVETIFAIEEAFDVQVPFNANEPGKSDFDISTVGAIVQAVQSLVTQQQG